MFVCLMPSSRSCSVSWPALFQFLEGQQILLDGDDPSL